MDKKRNSILRSTVLFFVFSFIAAFTMSANADYQTNLLPGVYIQNNGIDLDVGNWSAPTVYDWDNDGKKDLLIGQNTLVQGAPNQGYVSFYKNFGTDSAPSFNGSTYIQSCSTVCSTLNAITLG